MVKYDEGSGLYFIGLLLAVSTLREPVFPKDVFQERRDQVLTGIEAQRH